QSAQRYSARLHGECTGPSFRPAVSGCLSGRLKLKMPLREARPKGRVYQYTFRAICIWRGEFAWLVTKPNVALSRFVVPVLKTVRLKILKASARRSMRRGSRIRKLFARLTFSFLGQNARTFGL